MPDVIHALKRLERAGAEDSKTTQKLTEAAATLARKLEQILPPDFEFRAAWPQRKGDDQWNMTSCMRPTYKMESGKLVISTWVSFTNQKTHGELSTNPTRSHALAFAADIAEGLLDRFEAKVKELTANTAELVPVAEQAVLKLDQHH